MDVIDSKYLGTWDGFAIHAYLTPDNQMTPLTDGDYSDEAIDAWRSGDWSYVTVTVTASKSGVELGSSSLSGCEYGVLPGVSGFVSPLDGSGDEAVNGYGPDLIADAVASATETLTRVNA